MGRTTRIVAGTLLYGVAAAFFVYALVMLVLGGLALRGGLDLRTGFALLKVVLNATVAGFLGYLCAFFGRAFVVAMRESERSEPTIALAERAPMRRPRTIVRFAARNAGLSLAGVGMGAAAIALSLAGEVHVVTAIILLPCGLFMLVLGLLLLGIVGGVYTRAGWVARRLAISEAMGTPSPIYAPLYREPDARAWIGLP